jgi:hypothetical protein
VSTDAVRAALDTHDAEDAQAAADNTAAVERLNVQLQAAQDATLAAQQATALVQAAFDAYKLTHPDAPPPPPPPPPPPVRATIFGAYPGPLTLGGDAQSTTSRARLSKALGVSVLPADRVYSETGYGKAVQSPSPIVAVSYKQVAGLAAGTQSVVDAIAAEIRALASKPAQQFDVACDHEVDNKVKSGTYSAAAYAAAARRFRDIVHGIGAPNVRTAFCTMGWSYLQATSNAWHPANLYAAAGADCFDLLAPDVYWTSGYSTIEKAANACRDWTLAQGKPFAIWETGWQTTGQADPKYTEAQRLARVQGTIDYWRAAGARYVLWFEALKSDDNLLEGHPAALAAYGAAAQA